jgi:hypothetical protein
MNRHLPIACLALFLNSMGPLCGTPGLEDSDRYSIGGPKNAVLAGVGKEVR